MLVLCKCGYEFESSGRRSVRCHVCRPVMDLTPLYEEEAAETQSRAEHNARRTREWAEQQRPGRIARAEEMNYAGLRFDGVYRTSSPIILDSECGETLSLSLHFRRDLTVAYECHLVYEGTSESDVEEEPGTTDYKLLGESKIRFSFDEGWWETEWEGAVCAEQLRLTLRMEMYVGLSQGPKCVVEDEVTLLFVPSASIGWSQR